MVVREAKQERGRRAAIRSTRIPTLNRQALLNAVALLFE
jgi:hypothetical protein